MAIRKKKPAAKPAKAEDTAVNGAGPKEVKPVKKRRLRYFLLYAAAIGFAFYAVITIINQNVRIAEKRAELSELQQQINVVEIQSKYIEKVQNYTGKDLSDYMAKIAKEELGYVGDGERIFINVAGDQ
ncbi:MAG: septum formation initiator family protein [Ruminococcus sp.]|nr:septum formation initiator family protein [Ruminococcus sp.]